MIGIKKCICYPPTFVMMIVILQAHFAEDWGMNKIVSNVLKLQIIGICNNDWSTFTIHNFYLKKKHKKSSIPNEAHEIHFKENWPSLWHHMATWIFVNVGSGTKPLPEPMLTYDQWSSAAVTWSNFTATADDVNP